MLHALQTVEREISDWKVFSSSNVPVPLSLQSIPVWAVEARIQAGFPSAAEDSDGKRIDLLEHLIKHPQATYHMTVQGESMREAGIFNGDVVLIDKAIRPKKRPHRCCGHRW